MNAPDAPAYIARQPIFDEHRQIQGYELVHCVGTPDGPALNGNGRTAQVITAFLDIGLQRLVNSRFAMITVGEDFLAAQSPLPAQDHTLILMVDPEIVVTPAILTHVQFYRQLGYKIAVEATDPSTSVALLTPFAHIVRLDLARLGAENLKARVDALRGGGRKFLVVGLQRPEDSQVCRALGCEYFQGETLAGPQRVTERTLSPKRVGVLHLLARLYDPEVPVTEVERLVSQDPVIGFRLLRCVNSAMYARPRPVDSLRQAIAILGLRQVATWVSLISLSRLDDAQPEQLLKAMVRAKMCQLLAKHIEVIESDRMFTVGLLSVFDELLGATMEQVLQNIPVSPQISEALLHRTGQLGELLAIVEAYEAHRWDFLLQTKISPTAITQAWLGALVWADEAARAAIAVQTPAPSAPRDRQPSRLQRA